MAQPPSADTNPTSSPNPSPSVQPSLQQQSSSQPQNCKLRFLMVNGESFHMLVPASATVQHIKQKVINERPPELTEFLKSSTPSAVSGPSKVEEIRILHLGKFLDDDKTLKEYSFATGEDNHTTVHIAIKVAANASEDTKEKINKKANACCAVM